MHLHYFDIHKLSDEIEAELNLTYHDSVESLVAVCDVVNISCPLHPKTEHLFDDEMISKMKRGAYVINTARGKICDKDAIARGLESGQLSGYAGDVWFPQPAPNDHVWRTMPNHGMTPSYLRNLIVCTNKICCRRERNSRMLTLPVSLSEIHI